jgi:FkbM family methyltransferase
MQTTTREDVLACFRLLLGREPNAEEMAGHLGFAGAPLHSVVAAYLQSLEFRNRGLLQPGTEVEIVELEGFAIYVAKDDALIAPAIRAGYEPEVTRALLEHMAAGAVVDIGANCGYFSLLAASRGARVYAFEPLQTNLRLLHASVALNRFAHIRIIAAAASDSLRTLTIGAMHTNGMVAEPRNDPQAALAADFVAAVRVDDVVPGDEPVSVIKVDVEGHEYLALLGARRTIEACRPVILSEFAPGGLAVNSRRSATEYLELLSAFGYDVSVVGNPAANTTEAILAHCAGADHIDILALPR